MEQSNSGIFGILEAIHKQNIDEFTSKQIAELVGINIKSASRCLTSLVKLNLLTVSHIPRAKQGGLIITYSIRGESVRILLDSIYDKHSDI